MFLDNKYTRIYYQIIDKALSEHRKKIKGDGMERHHRIPKSLGGSNLKENLVVLTFREHFICHWLLTKMCADKNHKRKMDFAFGAMATFNANGTRKKLPSRYYTKVKEYLKLAQSEASRERWEDPNFKENMIPKLKGKRSADAVANMTSARQNRPLEFRSLEMIENQAARKRATYKITKINGDTLIVTHLREWCIENGYSRNFITGMKTGRLKTYRDILTVQVISEKPLGLENMNGPEQLIMNARKLRKIYRITKLDESEYITDNIQEWAPLHGYCHKTLQQVGTGKYIDYKDIKIVEVIRGA